MRNPKLVILFISLLLASVASLVLVVVDRVALASLLLVFAGVTATAYGILYYALDRMVLQPLRRMEQRLAALHIIEEETAPGFPASITDIEEALVAYWGRTQNELDRMRKLEQFRRDFIADVSHELKTPIFAAQGFVHTLLDGAAKEKATRKKFLKKAAKSLDGLDMLVQDLLTLSNIETGQTKMHFEYVNLYTLTEEVFDQFREKSSKKEVSLRIKSPSKKVMVYADKLRMHQVLTNLVSNAISHSREQGEVTVLFETAHDRVVTRVKDAGEGIPEKHIHRIFERFYRVDKSRSREKGGTGLGLAIVKHILDGHHSTAEVESTPGEGAIFSFSLPTGPDKQEE